MALMNRKVALAGRAIAGHVAAALTLLVTIAGPMGCSKDGGTKPPPGTYPPPDVITIGIPGFPHVESPEANPTTVQGVELGRRLFYDPILSADSTQACASCHQLGRALSDTSRFSIGIDGLRGDRNAPNIFNLAWGRVFFWDGRASGLEDQARGPVENPIEMHESWDRVVLKLARHRDYPTYFGRAFGDEEVTDERATRAIAQFERTILSHDAKYDRVLRGEELFSASELRGYQLFFTERADCFHCHGNVLATDFDFHNVGLEAVPIDRGRAKETGLPEDEGMFKTPSLRNIVYTAPYMHDGRFRSLDEVIDHYNSNVVESPNRSPFAHLAATGGLRLTAGEKADLKAFILTMTDSSFVRDPDYENPFER